MTFREVSRAEFFAFMDPKDVHPHAERDVTYWCLRNRQEIGKSVPGYISYHPETGRAIPKQWFIAEVGHAR